MKSAAVAGRLAVETQSSADWQNVTRVAVVAHSSKMIPLHPALITSKPALLPDYSARYSILALKDGVFAFDVSGRIWPIHITLLGRHCECVRGMPNSWSPYLHIPLILMGLQKRSYPTGEHTLQSYRCTPLTSHTNDFSPGQAVETHLSCGHGYIKTVIPVAMLSAAICEAGRAAYASGAYLTACTLSRQLLSHHIGYFRLQKSASQYTWGACGDPGNFTSGNRGCAIMPLGKMHFCLLANVRDSLQPSESHNETLPCR